MYSLQLLSYFRSWSRPIAWYDLLASAFRFQFAIGCVIVDPSTNVVVARSRDRRQVHPLQHAVMLCIDRVALTQGGGAWDSGHGRPTLD